MPLITCNHCGASGNAPDSIMGTTVRCSKCKQSFVAGGGAGPAEEELFQTSAPADAEIRDEAFDDDDRPRRSSRRPADDEDDDDRPRGRVRRPSNGDGGLGDLITFKKFIGPRLVSILFWVMAGACIVFGIIRIVVGASSHFMSGAAAFDNIMWGIILIFGGPIFARALCEVGIAALKTHEILSQKKDEPKET